MWGTALSRGNFQSENEKKTVTEIENASHIPYRRQIHAAIAVMNVFILIVVLLICVFQQSSVGFQNSFFGKGHLLSHRPSVLCNRESPPLYLSTIELEDFVNTIGIYIDSPIGGYAKDMMTAACLGTMSDVFAQIISQKGNDSNSVTASPPNDRAPTSREFKSGGLFPAFNSIRIDIKRTIRFAIFGFIDGAVGHTWFYTLETYVRTTRITDVFLRILIDAGLYTPIWCVWFLIAMTILEKGQIGGIGSVLKREWWSLLKLSTSFYLPISCLIYSVIPLQKRVFASAVGTMICTIALSLWNAARTRDNGSSNSNSFKTPTATTPPIPSSSSSGLSPSDTPRPDAIVASSS